jgi:hypothetical protein
MAVPIITPAAGIQRDLAVAAIPDDERVWVPQAKDDWSKIEMCRAHYLAAGLGARYVDQFVR